LPLIVGPKFSAEKDRDESKLLIFGAAMDHSGDAQLQMTLEGCWPLEIGSRLKIQMSIFDVVLQFFGSEKAAPFPSS
jgi:hypothetical protein